MTIQRVQFSEILARHQVLRDETRVAIAASTYGSETLGK
jgi:hypothetical protein